MISTDVANAMAEIYKLRDVTNFTLFGETTRHFRPGRTKMRGQSMHIKAFTQPYTGVRRTSVPTGSEAEFPAARSVDHVDVEIDWDDLTEF